MLQTEFRFRCCGSSLTDDVCGEGGGGVGGGGCCILHKARWVICDLVEAIIGGAPSMQEGWREEMPSGDGKTRGLFTITAAFTG